MELPTGMSMMLKSLGIDPQKAMDNVTALQKAGTQIIEALEKLDRNITEFRAEQERLTAHIAQLMENVNGRNQHEQSAAVNAGANDGAAHEQSAAVNDGANDGAEHGGHDHGGPEV